MRNRRPQRFNRERDIAWKDVLSALTSLIASFAGAWAAFRFQTYQRKDEQDQKSVGAGNRAIYAVFSLWNVLEQYRKEVLEEYRGRPDAWLNLAAHPAPPVKADRFQSSDLQFLLDRGHASTFAALMLEEQRFNLAVGLIRSRSELVLNVAFPKMAAAGFRVGKTQALEDVERSLGEDVCHQLMQTTGAIYQNVDEDLASLREIYAELRGAMKSIFPKHKFVEVVFEEPAKKQDAPVAA